MFLKDKMGKGVSEQQSELEDCLTEKQLRAKG
jgi:hypothetical protein